MPAKYQRSRHVNVISRYVQFKVAGKGCHWAFSEQQFYLHFLI
ncbi:hypothetical protein [Calothrix sp. FACHB-168]|nr:hypothetical protein [Calothrix sp. FACHB-168]